MRKRLFAALIMAALWLNVGFSSSNAQEVSIRPSTAGRIPVARLHLKVSAVGNLLSYDNTPLENREQLILIHGIAAEHDKYYHWARFLKFADHNPAFNRRFKIYLYRYDSRKSVDLISASLQETLRDFIHDNQGRHFRILAYSMGGLLTRNALQDPEISEATDKVLTVGTPFHGSPLASQEWFSQQLRNVSRLSPIRLSQRLTYWVAHHRYPFFQKDFGWDNFDRAIADKTLSAFKNAAHSPFGVSQYALADNGSKFITYGSFFGKALDPDRQLMKMLGLAQPLPLEFPHFKNLFSAHFLFTLARSGISSIKIANGSPAGKITPSVSPAIRPLMVFNDGISPISSTLWLGRFTRIDASNPLQVSEENGWNTLQLLRSTQSARLFSSLDHRDWLDGTTRCKSSELQDLLHPGQPAKTVFQWFIDDLMSS